ncbi:hypothetical protein [Mycolicibacterium tokaiense]|uniref:Uncharacterized protein n=1 Tax=Mycolicibacterium tokaiense TaxID=39695 RepID=A0A378TAW0_9MYCO|nr:hypothetical protein [Mycolicibacterium tokaiense]BBY88460.1 hypothetical protein MTOK_42420 [Mycolicibacterium tokaiense]STZ57015.1 Uncharacterised protein [Mycolicibacterium tokaiense]
MIFELAAQAAETTTQGSDTSLWPVIIGGLVGAGVTQLFTFAREYRRNRDGYRTPQRAAIGEIIAASNTLKVCLTDAMEHLGLTGRQTSDDAAAQSINNFVAALLSMDEKFSIGRLTIVDTPCREKMLETYLVFSNLRTYANKVLTANRQGFGEFLRLLTTTSNQMDDLIAELVDLAEDRLRPTRGLFSKRSKMVVSGKNPSTAAKNQPTGATESSDRASNQSNA